MRSILTDGVGPPPPGRTLPTLIRFLARKASWHDQGSARGHDPGTVEYVISGVVICLAQLPEELGTLLARRGCWERGREGLSAPRTRLRRAETWPLITGPPTPLGTNWESRALTWARYGSVLLACARLDLRKRRNSLVAPLGMHSWGSRGRRFKSGRPDW